MPWVLRCSDSTLLRRAQTSQCGVCTGCLKQPTVTLFISASTYSWPAWMKSRRSTWIIRWRCTFCKSGTIHVLRGSRSIRPVQFPIPHFKFAVGRVLEFLHATHIACNICLRRAAFFLGIRIDIEPLKLDPYNEYGPPGWLDSCSVSLSSIIENDIWTPDVYFINEKFSFKHTVTMMNAMFRLLPQGDVLYSIRITMKLSCQMDLSRTRSPNNNLLLCPTVYEIPLVQSRAPAVKSIYAINLLGFIWIT